MRHRHIATDPKELLCLKGLTGHQRITQAIRKWVKHQAGCLSATPNKFTVGQRKKVTAVTFFPAQPRSDQRGTNTDEIRKVPLDEIA